MIAHFLISFNLIIINQTCTIAPNYSEWHLNMLKRVAIKKTLTILLFLGPNFLCPANETRTAPLSKTRQERQVSPRIDSYLKIIYEHQKNLGPLGSWKKGEIEIVINPEQIKKIENQMRLHLISKGCQESEAALWSSVGVVAEDTYWMWIRDAVIFPSGVYGTYDRLLWKSGMDGPPTVAIFPVLSNKKIVVNLSYRHATRSWEIELPRGQRQPHESLEKAAARELLEETGYHLSKSMSLGTMAPDSGVLNSVVPLFYGEVCHSGENKKEYSKAISENPVFTKQELKEGFVRGYLEIPINGQIVKVNCRDPYLAFSILQAEGKGLL